MAEVLSQSQIDMLLTAALSGNMNDLDGEGQESQDKKYRKYDFHSPRKFTKDRLRILNGIFDSYSRIINNRINGLLRSACEIEVESIEEQRFYEFSNALTEGDVLTLAHLDYKGRSEETPVLLYVSRTVMLSMIDRLIGGTGDPDEHLSPDYTFTDLEMKLYENLMKNLVSLMGSSWESYLSLNFDFGRVEPNPTLVQLVSLNETVVIVDLLLRFPNCEGRLSICLPGMMLTNLFSDINRGSPERRIQDEDKSEEIFTAIRDTDLELTMELCSTKLQLQDIFHLSVGDVIDLNRSKDSPVYINIGGYRWFEGQMGVYNKNMAVKIANIYFTPQERDEEQDD
ncbi:MAG: flagellar motor switch protein FliM [Firmicutes bacterium]|nr:flagellar motor switch protein FliM [Bacillota bacterium]